MNRPGGFGLAIRTPLHRGKDQAIDGTSFGAQVRAADIPKVRSALITRQPRSSDHSVNRPSHCGPGTNVFKRAQGRADHSGAHSGAYPWRTGSRETQSAAGATTASAPPAALYWGQALRSTEAAGSSKP